MVSWLACWTSDLKVGGLRPGLSSYVVSLLKSKAPVSQSVNMKC